MLYVEIKPGEGGDDAALFATQLTDAITRYAAGRWTVTHEDSALILDGNCL